ncbi:hypothetical protein [Nocardia sp. NPDC051570]|uniref:hypothetical protein n=1 Tax=Nocardia sp. NPDC051570 TaxID=3364324 RepID=UPI0037952DF4
MSATSINSCTSAYERARHLLGGADVDPELRPYPARPGRIDKKLSRFDAVLTGLRAAALARKTSG